MNKLFLISLLIISVVACTPQNRTSAATSSSISATSTVTLTPIETSAPEILSTLTSTPELPDQILISPNEEFIAEFDNAYGHPAFEPQVIKILDKKGSLLWVIPYQHEIERVDPHPSLKIHEWSKDSTYLYFFYEFFLDGGEKAFWWDGFDLQRINVQSGKIEPVILGQPKGFAAFAFSPDKTQIAYTREQDSPSVIFIRHLSTGAEKTANVIFPSKSYERVGDIHWSPSGTGIAFQTETSDHMAQTIYLNLSTMKQRVIREYKLYSLVFQGWSGDDSLEFLDYENGKNIFHVNPSNNETTIIGTPTPIP